MVPLTIAIDMDDVLENLTAAWCEELNRRYGTNVHDTDLKEWDMSVAFPELLPTQIYGVLEEPEFWDTVKPMPGAVESVRQLINMGHSVYVVTASSLYTIRDKMERCLFKYFPFLTWGNVVITQKKQIINCDVMIDDAPHNLIGGCYAKILYLRPFNMTAPYKAHKIQRVRSWDEIMWCIGLLSGEDTTQYTEDNEWQTHNRLVSSTKMSLDNASARVI